MAKNGIVPCMDTGMLDENVDWFCRQVRTRSHEHHQAMLIAHERGWLSIAVGILRQELDSMVRVVFLLSQPDRRQRNALLVSAVSGQPWTVPTPEGKMRRVTDRDMVELAQNLHGWARNVYRFGCGFIHLSHLHDYPARDPFRALSIVERQWVADYLRQYHGGEASPDSTFQEISAYMPRVLEKISSNLEHYLEVLESDGEL
jgi:hypothetical protein